MSEQNLTPLMQQFRDVKQAHPTAIVFFRVGDFYEMFYEDAEEASSLLNIALTSRDKNSPNPVPLCGVPHHAASNYIAKLLQAGKTVALCEQVEDPKLAKGLVRREVVRLYTPGTLFDDELLDGKHANFLAAVDAIRLAPTNREWRVGLAAVDLSTGEFVMSEFGGHQAYEDAVDELVRLEPNEIIYPEGDGGVLAPFLAVVGANKLPTPIPQKAAWFQPHAAKERLTAHFQVETLKELHLDSLDMAIQAGGGVLHYLRETQPTFNHGHIRQPQIRHLQRDMCLDSMTIRNLELLKPLSSDQRNATLLAVLDHTVTSMGGRLLRDWLVRPLTTKDLIQRRLDGVSALTQNVGFRLNIRTELKTIRDIERVSTRISMGSANPRDLLHLRDSLTTLPKLLEQITPYSEVIFKSLCHEWDNLQEVFALIDTSIMTDAPIALRDGSIIQDGYDSQVDELRIASKDGTRLLADLEVRERRRSGIDSLKIKFNQVFGYYYEITKSNLSRVPLDFTRKQTLANAERFTNSELQALEDQVTGGDQKLRQVEQEIFFQIRSKIAGETTRIQRMAQRVAILDVLSTFAEVGSKNRYVCPDLHEGGVIHIVDGRHPVIEQLRPAGDFIPNDAYMDLDDQRLLLITGPNMAGKSTYLRQLGLITLMAQIGSFVPASSAKIGLVDHIFTRVGASDNLASGHSTFMVEMMETARLLQAATPKSLILLDEIGRGTSTYDGLSLAWAIAEYIQDQSKVGARTLFATHYHEMTEMEKQREGVKNFTVAVKEDKGDVIFLRKIIPGKADRSYGLHVAKLAGLPHALLCRAQEVLMQLEQSEGSNLPQYDLFSGVHPDLHHTQDLPAPHPILEEMKQLDLFSMTPLDALNRLADFKRRMDSE
ncbi:MAG: DNA mismatch repair protein MutS [Nitrospirota bacterium]|nr:DNA mismatch repair protein MutS [Nitrospirota bacterium]